MTRRQLKRRKIKKGQLWKDKKTGDVLQIICKHHDIYWNVVFERSTQNHKMTEFILRKYYELIT